MARETTADSPATGHIEHNVSRDGVSIAWQRAGAGDPALVFVHGLACDAGHWRHQLAHFSDRFTCLAVDLAGHGRSDSNRDAWSIEAFGDDVAAVIDVVARDVILVGHSLGGPVCLEAAQRVCGRVIGVIGVESFHWLGEELSQPRIDALLAAYEADHQGAVDASVRGWFPEDADPALVDRVVRQALGLPPDVYLAALRHLLEWFPRRAEAAIAAWPGRPVTINSTRFGAELLARPSRAGLDVVGIEETGHFPMLEKPLAFNRLLEQQVDRILGRRAPERA